MGVTSARGLGAFSNHSDGYASGSHQQFHKAIMMIRNLAMSGISVVAALGIAAPANADQYDFISVLDNNGVYYYNISEMIDLGKAACRTVRTGGTIGSVDSAINLLTRAGFNAVMDRAIIMTAAANTMCPDIWPALNAHNQAARDLLQGTAPAN